MKRYAIPVALGLILVFSLSPDSGGKQRPDWFPSQVFEDHTWGGENGFGDSINPGDEGFRSGLFPWESIVNRVIFMILPDGKTGVRTTPDAVSGESVEQGTQPSVENIQSSKGN